MKLQSSEEQFVSLQKGDCIKWYKQDGTIGFYRQRKCIARNSGDDKFLIYPTGKAQFSNLASLIAELHGLEVKLSREDSSSVHLEFV